MENTPSSAQETPNTQVPTQPVVTQPLSAPVAATTEQPLVQPQPVVSAPQQQEVPAASSQPAKKSHLMLYGAMILILLILIGGSAYLLLSKSATTSNQITQTLPTAAVSPTVVSGVTPMITPITASNADQQVNNTTTAIDQSLQQANKDIDSLNNIDTNQDNANATQ